MKIDILRIIEDALVGGRNGEMAYIENNPFVSMLFREYLNNNQEKGFSDFLKDCLDIKPEEENKTEVSSTKNIIKKNIKIDDYNSKFKEYKNAVQEVNKARKELENKKRELAESLDELLPKISSYEIKYHEYWQSMEFTIYADKIDDLTQNNQAKSI